VDRQAQIDLILDHYENPRHYGALPGATVVRTGRNPGCGDEITFYLRVESNGRIAAISFEGEGCTISQAAASVTAEMLAYKTLAEVEEIPSSAILGELGYDIASTRLGCATLGLNTAKEAARAARRDFRDSDDV
jgi:nitrogen fixation protein NifU and related proteins